PAHTRYLLSFPTRRSSDLLAAGPYLEANAYERLHAQVLWHPNWQWTRLLDPLPLWIKASDLFIGSGGYNSLAEIIATGANALIIDRKSTRLNSSHVSISYA